MVASRDLNGDVWPELPSSTPDLPRLEARPDPLVLAQAYATFALHYGQYLPKVSMALEYLHGHVIGARGDVAKIAAEMKKLREELQGQRAMRELGLPAMRPEAPSTVDVAECIKTKVSGAFEQIAKETKGPHIEADPKRLAAVVGAAVDEELARREAAQKAKKDAEELEMRRQTDVQRQKDRRKIIRVMVLAFAAAVATAAGTWTWGKASGVAEEGRRQHSTSAPPAAVPAIMAPAK